MSHRPTPKSLESLHVTLQKLEQTGDPGQDNVWISKLKRVLVNRIADLELSKTFESEDYEIDKAPEPADLIPPPSMAEEGAPGKGIDETPLDKLD
jgi:hypothetical protein